MVICKFYAAGNCRFGDSCRFEHVNQRSKTYNNYDPPKPANSTGFSFLKSLQKVEQQQQQQSLSQQPAQWQPMSNQNPVKSFFGGQAPATSNKPAFSFNQTLSQVYSGQPSIPSNVRTVFPQQTNLPIIQEVQMDGDIDIAPSSEFQFRNQNQSNQTRRSFFDTPTTPQQQQSQQQTSNQKSSQNPNNDLKVTKSEIYTSISQLSGADLANFKADKFQRPIPICAPPLEVCF